MRTKTILILATLLLAALWTHGQQWQTIDMRDGLSESRVRRIAQMPDGRMAIATTATIDIYDFTRFTAYKLSPDYAYPLPEYTGDRQLTCDTLGNIFLRGNRTLYILDTRHQRLVANVDSMLTALQLTRQEVAGWPVENENPLTTGRSDVMTVARDSYGGLWVGTKESGILYSNPDRQQQFHTFVDSAFVFKRRPNFCSPRTSQLSAHHAPSATNCTLETGSHCWLGTRQGIMVFDNKDSFIVTIDERDGLSTNNIQALVSDLHGDVWAATADGITRIHIVGRDSFLINNFGRFDGINVGGREFRTCQIHCDNTTGIITIGFAGGIVTFNPDSIRLPHFSFQLPRQLSTEENHSTSWILIVLPIVLLLALALYWILRRSHAPAANDEGKRNVLIPKPTDATLEKLSQQAPAPNADEQFLTRLQQIVEAGISNEDFSVQTLSEQMAMDRTGLYRRMQSLTGMSPSNYIKQIRMEVAARLLRDTSYSIQDIAFKTGFSTTKYFNKVFKEHFGMSPKEYRE